MTGSSVAAIIPARGGSKGLPGKHLRRIGGVPMIVHTIRAALAARRVDRVIVSTDDERIASVARDAGAEVPWLRPAHLATDETPTALVVRHAVAWLAERDGAPDVIVTLQPTSPLRTAEQIDATIALLDDATVSSAVTVTLLDLPVSVIGTVADGRFVAFAAPERDVRRQAVPSVARLTGGVYVTRRDLLVDQDRLLDDSPAALVVDSATAVDVDTADDLRLARRSQRELGA